MKVLNFRWLLLISVIGIGTAVVSTNVGCGSSGGSASDGGAGTGGHGGSAGSGHDAAPYTSMLNFTFDSNLQGWALSTYNDQTYFNFGVLTDPDSGVAANGKVVPTFVWTADDQAGVSGHGSAKVDVTYTGYNEYIDPTVNLSSPVDLSTPGVFLNFYIKLVSGTFNGGVQLHISSGLSGPNAYTYAAQFFNATGTLMAGQWVKLTLDPNSLVASDSTKTFDPSQIVQIGVQFTTGSAQDGGAPPAGDVVFQIDSIIDKKAGT
jgi:hypothetical protein